LLAALTVAAIAYLIRRRSKGIVLQTVRLVEKAKVTHDTFLFTFLLEDQTQPLGLKIGEHIEVR